jgi:hypothetical protein
MQDIEKQVNSSLGRLIRSPGRIIVKLGRHTRLQAGITFI